MPAPGDQHLPQLNGAFENPFAEPQARMSEYTAHQIGVLQGRLEKQLGPEYISSRDGPSGKKVHYVAAEKCIQLANEIFGFNGWSSQVRQIQVDFVEENQQSKVSLGLSVIVRVTLRDGTFHEDLGYGHIENCKGKAAAFEKAKKEGVTDALKRALRNFGNVLGNCIYDKEYLKKVTKLKVQPQKFAVENLHRHADYAPAAAVIPPVAPSAPAAAPAAAVVSAGKKVVDVEMKPPPKQNGHSPEGDKSILSTEDEFDDFDEADFTVGNEDYAHPDEVSIDESATSQYFGNVGNGTGPSRAASTVPSNKPGPPHTNGNAANLSRPAVQPPQAVNRQTNGAGHQVSGPQPGPQPRPPQTPNNGFARSTSGAGRGMPVQRSATDAPRPVVQQPTGAPTQRVLNQPSRTGGAPPVIPVPPNAPVAQNHSSNTSREGTPPVQGAPAVPSVGFFSAKAASLLADGESAPNNARELPQFNPHAESPSIRKTPGIDHNKSIPLTREGRHVPKPSHSTNGGPGAAGGFASIGGGMGRGSVVNPHLDATRRIGVPGGGGSPLANRSAYKPPTMAAKRSLSTATGGDGRPPLGDVSANGIVGGGNGGDLKRQRVGGGA